MLYYKYVDFFDPHLHHLFHFFLEDEAEEEEEEEEEDETVVFFSLICTQTGHPHFPSGTTINGGSKHAVWYTNVQ